MNLLALFLLSLFISSSIAWKLPSSSTQSKSAIFSQSFKKSVAACLLSFGIASGSSVLSVNAAEIPAIGSPAPSFSLPSNAGKKIALEDLVSTGKRTVLYFYPGDFTQGCTIEAQGFQRDISKFDALNTQIVGISVDSVDKHLDFGKKYGLDFPLLSDQGGLVSAKYGSLLDFGFIGKFSNRQTYVISPDSKIQYVFTDVESRVQQHSQDVLEKLASAK